MKQRILFFSLALFFLGLLLSCGAGTGGEIALAREPFQSESIPQHIKDATVQITIEVPDPDAPNVTIVEPGFGTLIRQDGETFLVTHSHWKQLSEGPGLVYIRNVDGQILYFSPLGDFRRRIRYSDGGTTIFKVPEALQAHALGNPVAGSAKAQPEVGDAVVITHREILETSFGVSIQVTFHQARVQAVETKNGLPVFRLQSQDGHTVVPGDSGGGVWFNGNLVANMWTTIMVEREAVSRTAEPANGLQPTDISIAAQFPQK